MASFVPLHGSWCWFKVKTRARKVPGRARPSDDERAARPQFVGRLVSNGSGGRRRPQLTASRLGRPNPQVENRQDWRESGANR